MHITFHTEHLTQHDAQILRAIASAFDFPAAAVSPQPQPEVGDNTGTSSTGITLSPGADGVSEPVGSDAPGSAPEITAFETPKRTRKPKQETAAAPADPTPAPAAAAATTESGASVDTASSASSAAPQADTATKLTLDDVRAKLQAFTGAKGIDAGLALLGEFKAGRISELKAEDYPAFVAKCEVA